MGDEATGLRATFVVTAGDTKVRATVDFLILRRERAVAMLTTSGIGETFPEEERARLAQKMADRMSP